MWGSFALSVVWGIAVWARRRSVPDAAVAVVVAMIALYLLLTFLAVTGDIDLPNRLQ